MHDWDRIVNQRLPKLKLPEIREADIREELASHFAELHADFLTKTGSEEEAMRLALAEIGDWGALARKIRLTEKLGMLSPRVRTLWLPGVMGIAVAMLTSVAESALLRMMPDGGTAFTKTINHSGFIMPFLGLWLLPAGLVGSGIAWYLGASAARRVCAAVLPLVVFWIAGVLVPLGVGAPLPIALVGKLEIIPYFGAGLIAGGLPFFFRGQRLGFLPRGWMA
jgi:hypothetical protein